MTKSIPTRWGIYESMGLIQSPSAHFRLQYEIHLLLRSCSVVLDIERK
jgi:hypothetical protein